VLRQLIGAKDGIWRVHDNDINRPIILINVLTMSDQRPARQQVSGRGLALAKDGQLCRYCFYSRTDFSVFRPAPIMVKFGRVELTDRLRGVGLRPQNFENLEFYQYNIARFLQNLQFLCAFSVYINLPNLADLAR